ncbi:MAG TPA: DUF1549 and DUF1553 domain-containing protein [Humisphaera sp.]|nr:DUF1549 and DUF1553 domain-containing protein [Humisphaera sp.]
MAFTVCQSIVAATATDHWAFRKPVDPPIPAVSDPGWAANPIDSFVFAKLQAKGLSPAKPADKRTLIRRAYFDLTGLPPTAAQVEAFEADSSPDAFAKVVDELLASPQYGERWGRYWLDVARYSDTKGYVFQEERKYPYAYTYRDWVVRSLNDDLPYDQFLIQQIAADQLQSDDKQSLAAMGFLTVGRRFLNSKPDIVDDRLDVVFRGTMALTVGCARCHDHKFDPIPTADYYSLYSVFNNSIEPTDLPLIGEPEHNAAYEKFEQDAAKLQGEYDKYVQDRLNEMLTDLRTPKRIADYMMASLQPAMRQQRNQDSQDLNFAIVNQWRTYLQIKAKDNDSVFAAWRKFVAISGASFGEKTADVMAAIAQPDSQHPLHPLVVKEFSENAPSNLRDVADRYGALLARYDKPDQLPDESEEWLRQVLRGEDSPLKLPKPGADAERLLRRDFRDKAANLRKKVDEFKANNPSAPPRAMVMRDAPNMEPQRVFMRGNAGNPGEAVKPHFLTCVSGETPAAFSHGSGRLELAQAIASKDNPLTARVMVNRVWLHHFGFGLVRTPSDFGTRSDPPTHPELLDYLAIRFMEDGWSIKKLHRRIMLSATYQQSSEASPDAQQRDADNLLLSHMNRQRLDLEAMRDSLMYVSGKLDLTIGGRPVDITVDPAPNRRMIYAFIDRQNLPGVFRNFDFASPDATCPRRFSTTVPQQALFMLNSPFLMQQVHGVLSRPELKDDQPIDQRIEALYALLFERKPTKDEIAMGREFIEHEASIPDDDGSGGAKKLKRLSPWEKYAQVLMESNEFIFVD